MDLISAKAYENAKVHFIQVKHDFWLSIKRCWEWFRC